MAPSTSGAVTLGRPPESEAARVSHLQLLGRAAALRAQATARAQARNQTYQALKQLTAPAAAAAVAADGVPVAPLAVAAPLSLRAAAPSSVWAGPSPLLSIQPHTLPPSKCTWSLQHIKYQALHRTAQMQHQPHARVAHGDTQLQLLNGAAHSLPKISYASVTQCYEEERAERTMSRARSGELLLRSRAQLHKADVRRRLANGSVGLGNDGSASAAPLRPRLTRPLSSGLSRSETLHLLQPSARLYDAAPGRVRHQASLSSLLLDEGEGGRKAADMREQKQNAAFTFTPPHVAGAQSHGANAAASSAPGAVAAAELDPAELARQKARARLAATFHAMQAAKSADQDLARQAGSFSNLPKRPWFTLACLVGSLYLAVLTPFSAAFYSSRPEDWVSLAKAPFVAEQEAEVVLHSSSIGALATAAPGGGSGGGGGSASHQYYAPTGHELSWTSSTVLPWLLADLLLSWVFLLETWLCIRYHSGGYLYTQANLRDEDEDEDDEDDEGETAAARPWRKRLRRFCRPLYSRRARSYMRQGLLLDLLACAVPWELLAVGGLGLRWAFLFRLGRVWLVRRFPLYIGLLRARWKASLGQPSRAHTQRISFLVLGILAVVHWFACLWFFLSAHDYTDSPGNTGARNSWMKSSCVSVRDCASIGANYLNALYWSFANFTMVSSSCAQ